jgi:REP element-mobilizing transposase RayT
MPDHVHLLVNLPPTISLSDALRGIKANSSKWINERDDLPTKFGWQDGYAAFSVSLSQKPRVMSYIRNQARHHRECDFKEELLMLLERNRIAYDARFLWD